MKHYRVDYIWGGWCKTYFCFFAKNLKEAKQEIEEWAEIRRRIRKITVEIISVNLVKPNKSYKNYGFSQPEGIDPEAD